MGWQTVAALTAAGILLVSILLMWNAGLVCGRYDSRERRSLRGTLRWLALLFVILSVMILAVAAARSGWILLAIGVIVGPCLVSLWLARLVQAGSASMKAILLYVSIPIYALTVMCAASLLVGAVAGESELTAVALGVALVTGALDLLLISAAAGFAIWLQFRTAREQSLIWLLAAAADRGAPLHDAAHAFADENSDDHHARELSLLLQAGAPLPEALRRVGIALPVDVRLAVEVGARLNLFGQCMSDVSGTATEFETLIRENVERLLYFMVVMAGTTGVAIFLNIKIFPVMKAMTAEFGIGSTSLIDSLSDFSPWLLLLSVMMLVVMSVASYVGALFYIECLPANFLFIDLFTSRLDGSRLLRVLSASVARGQPLAPTLRLLTLHFPRNATRARLYRTGQMVSDGKHWIESMRDTRLISEAECAVMKTAEKAGNLSWAMASLADMTAQRLAYRMRFWFSIIFPAIICLASVFYMLLAISLFVPLSSLIEALA